MQVSAAGREFIRLEEGVVLRLYKDQVGIWTIGVGHRVTGPELTSKRFDNGITDAEADAILTRDLRVVEGWIRHYVDAPLEQHQFDALASLCFNVGSGPLLPRDSVAKALEALDYEAAAKEFSTWCHGYVGGKKVKLPVLVARRAREAKLFLGQL